MPISTDEPLPEGVQIEADGSWVVKGVKINAGQIQVLVEGLSAKGIALPLHPADQPWEVIKAVAQRLVQLAEKQDRAGLVQAVLELIGQAPDALELQEQPEEAAAPDALGGDGISKITVVPEQQPSVRADKGV